MNNLVDVMSFRVRSGQFKIQQMVFVIMATAILFSLVSLFYISSQFGSLQQNVEGQRRDQVISDVRKMSGSPEFNFGSSEDCASCIDLDKVFFLKNRTSYQGFWKDLSLLRIERLTPRYSSAECTSLTYPKCNSITLVETPGYQSYEAFVSLCAYDGSIRTTRCELGKILIGFKGVTRAN